MIKKHVDLLFLLLVTILVKIFSIFPDAVERYYSNGIYPVISRIQRILTGWLPFSVGDILYFLAGLYLLLKAIGLVKKIIRKQIHKQYL